MSRRIVRCNRCRKEHRTGLWTPGDMHRDCGGLFIPIKTIDNDEEYEKTIRRMMDVLADEEEANS